MKKIETVCVVGAGVDGLSAVKECKEAGLKVTAFDRQAQIGGRWMVGDRSKGDATGLWSEMFLNGTRRSLEFGDFPWNPTTVTPQNDYAGMFPNPREFGTYLEAYSKHFRLNKHVQFNTSVKRVQQDENNKWTVITCKDGKDTKHCFDTLILCNGFFDKPHRPYEALLKPFVGQVLHSKYIRSTKDYTDKRVRVIGSAVSGPEITYALAEHSRCKSLVNSIRHTPYHFVKVSPIDHKPIVNKIFIRLPTWLAR